MISNYKGVVKCIEEDFKYFCDIKYLTLKNNLIYNTYYNFSFNHESPYHADLYLRENWPEGPNHFVNNNYLHFIERYNNRIKSFLNYLNNPNNTILFIIQFAYDKCPDDNNLFELKNVLQKKYPNLDYKIIIIK
jgi:hypothetical protein